MFSRSQSSLKESLHTVKGWVGVHVPEKDTLLLSPSVLQAHSLCNPWLQAACTYTSGWAFCLLEVLASNAGLFSYQKVGGIAMSE